MERDAEHLRLLSIFHYVYAGMSALYAMIPLIHLCVGVGLLTMRLAHRYNGPPAFLGLIFIGGALFAIAVGWTHAVLVYFAGRFLAARTHYVYCFVIAVLNCVFFPMGTLLGIFTIIVLSRPTVKGLFESMRTADG